MKKSKRANLRKQEMGKKDIIVKIITILSIIIVIAVASNFINKLDTVTIKTESHEFYKYFAGEKIWYEGSLKITKKNDITELTTESGSILLDNVPIYFSEQEDRAILPATMSITFPLESCEAYKVNSLTQVYMDYGDVYLEKGALNKKIENAFLFDADSVYFFLDRTVLSVNGTEYELAPLSYVNATHGGYVEIYNKETDEYVYIETINEDVIAKTSNYQINLTVDSVKCGGKEKLLTTKIKELTNLE